MDFKTAFGPVDYTSDVDFQGQESVAVQYAKDECDINKIMAKWQRDGVIEHVKEHGGSYGDFTVDFDYHEALNRVIEANDMFMALPSSVRAQFDNDPGNFLQAVSDPDQNKKLVELGLATKNEPELATDLPKVDEKVE